MSLSPNIILIGFMGSGKTTSGRELARRIGFEFVDLDERIQTRTGKSIDEIFQLEGESDFRSLERQEVEMIGSRNRTVICPGGGAWLDEQNRRTLLKSGWCIWLKVSPGEAWRRIQADRALRPLIHRAQDPYKEIERLLEERNPIYSLAHQRIGTDGVTPEEVADRILDMLKDTQPFPCADLGRGQ